jgi:2-aminoethylphosphonate-pyruvate transaminase
VSVRRAIILAAGIGARLRPVIEDRPKGLIDIGGETLVGRSVRLLRDAGVSSIGIVVGHRAGDYERFADGQTDMHLLPNAAYASSGSMASLAIGLADVDEDVFVLESDIAYERRALDTLLHAPPDATLMSGPTRAGDEVWVHAPGGALRAMSKTPADLPSIDGEFVGISRLSPAGCAAMRDAYARFERAHGHGRMDYETGALVEVASRLPVAAILVSDLLWGEIDDERHLARIRADVWPRL